MPLKINRRCNVCRLIEAGDNELLKRIYHCARFRTDGESIMDIWRDYENKFSYQSLFKHIGAHQAIRASDLKRSLQKQITKQGSNAAVMEMVKHGEIRQEVMNRGMRQLKSGRIKLRAADILRAAKDQADVEAKLKDQGFLAIELMMKLASGQLAPTGEEDGNTPGGNSIGATTAANYNPPRSAVIDNEG